jgi:2-dehydropantoate 2-reductase
MRVAILGAGALGGAYAAKLCAHRPAHTVVVARGERLHRLSRDGFVVNGALCRPAVVDCERSTTPVGLILVAVKARQLAAALEDIASLVGPGTILVSLMNGVESEQKIADRYPFAAVLYGVSVGLDATREGNVIRYRSQGTLYLGQAVNSPASPQVRRVRHLIGRCGIIAKVPRDMLGVLWWKFMVNAAINPLSGVLKAPYGVFQAKGWARRTMIDAAREVMAVAAREGVALGRDPLGRWLAVLDTLDPSGKTSMMQDLEVGRATEVQSLSGHVVKLGARHGLATPVNNALLSLVRAAEKEGSKTS